MALIIRSSAEIQEGIAALRRLDPRLAILHDLCGEPPLRLREGGLEGLASIVVSQQVSTASAQAIWARTRAVFDPFTPQRLIGAPDSDFRAGGLSIPKIRTLRAVAQAMSDGLDIEALAGMEAEKAHAALTGIKGIGPWTAEIYLMFCLGHADAFPAGDLALQEAARLMLALDKRPDARALGDLAEVWRPWRGVAARLLFAYYARMKGRAAVPLPEGETHDDA